MYLHVVVALSCFCFVCVFIFFFFQAEDGIRDHCVTGVQTCALPIFEGSVNARVSGTAASLLATVSVAFDIAMTVVGMSGIALICPETFEVSPVNTNRPSSCPGARAKAGCVGSLTPANAHCVLNQANFR